MLLKPNQLIFLNSILGRKVAGWREWMRRLTGNSLWFHCQALKSDRSAINLRKPAVNVCNKFVIILWVSSRSQGLTAWQFTFSVISPFTRILEQLRENIICVPGGRNIKNTQSDGDVQAGFTSAPGLARQTTLWCLSEPHWGTGITHPGLESAPPLSRC